MTYFHPVWLEHQRKRFTRPGAWRLAPPGTPEARPPGYLHPSARIAAFERAQQEEAEREAAEREEFQRKLGDVRHELEELKRQIAVKCAAWKRADEAARIRCDVARDGFIRIVKRYAEQQKAGYNPDQPRVLAGNPGAGEWTRVGGTGSAPKRVHFAADITGFTKHGINQAISRGISPASLHEAVVKPLQILPQANGTTQYVGRGAVVVLNPLGQVVTTWPQ
jgi:hypothetical protein